MNLKSISQRLALALCVIAGGALIVHFAPVLKAGLPVGDYINLPIIANATVPNAAASTQCQLFQDLTTGFTSCKKSDGTIIAAMANPMTTSQDIIVGGASGVPSRLAHGADGTFLGMVSGSLTYATPAGGSGGTLYTETGASCGSGTTCTYTGFTLAANTLTATGAGSCMDVLTGFRNTTDNNNWTAALVLGGTTVTTTAGVSASAISTTQFATIFRICNTGTRTAQVTKTILPQSANVATLADATSTIDFTASKTVNVLFTGAGIDTIVREALFVRQE